MNRIILSTLAAVAAFAVTPTAQAAAFIPGDPQFQVFGDINNGPVAAIIGNGFIAKGSFTDTFSFIINQNGFGTGSVTTATTMLFNSSDIDITSVFVNSVQAIKSVSADGLTESFQLANPVSIFDGIENLITVVGVSRGQGSYGGQIAFTPSAVPESATWGMMIIGFGMMGAAMRYRRRETKVTFA